MTDWDEVWNRKGSLKTDDLREISGYTHTSANMYEIGASIVKELKLKPGDRLLDVGCGAGAIAKELLDLVPGLRYIGTDRSAAMVKKHIEVLGNSVLNFNAHEAVFNDLFFDCAICVGVFQYFESHQYAKSVLKQLMRQAYNVYIGDVPVRSHSEDHKLYKIETLTAWVNEVSSTGQTSWRTTPSQYNSDRYNLIIIQEK